MGEKFYTKGKVDALISEINREIAGVSSSVGTAQSTANEAKATATDALSAGASALSQCAGLENSKLDISGTAADSEALGGYGASDYVKHSDLADVATTGEYSSLSGTPDLAPVATSGSYNDLDDRPDIPTEAWQVNALPSGTTAADIGGLEAEGTAYDSYRLGGSEWYNYYLNGSSSDLNCGSVNASGGVSASGDVTSNGGTHNLANKLDSTATAFDSYRLDGRDASDYALKKSGDDFECQSIYTGTGGIMSSGEIESNDGTHKLSLKLNAADAPYKLNTNGTILDRAVNVINASGISLALTPPSVLSGKVRDFVLRIECTETTTIDWSAFGNCETTGGKSWSDMMLVESGKSYIYRFTDMGGDYFCAAREEIS